MVAAEDDEDEPDWQAHLSALRGHLDTVQQLQQPVQQQRRQQQQQQQRQSDAPLRWSAPLGVLAARLAAMVSVVEGMTHGAASSRSPSLSLPSSPSSSDDDASSSSSSSPPPLLRSSSSGGGGGGGGGDAATTRRGHQVRSCAGGRGGGDDTPVAADAVAGLLKVKKINRILREQEVALAVSHRRWRRCVVRVVAVRTLLHSFFLLLFVFLSRVIE